MPKLLLIKRKKEIIFEISVSPKKKVSKDENQKSEITSITMMSRRIDEYEDEVRKRMESEMKIFSCSVHSQKFLMNLIPSMRDKKC